MSNLIKREKNKIDEKEARLINLLIKLGILIIFIFNEYNSSSVKGMQGLFYSFLALLQLVTSGFFVGLFLFGPVFLAGCWLVEKIFKIDVVDLLVGD